MAEKILVKLTANVERNLEEVDAFLLNADTRQTFDTLLDELLETVIPNLERFPDLGRRLFDRQTRSIEVGNGIERLKRTLAAAGDRGEIREYVLSNYLLLYARFDQTLYLLAIRHHRQLSFDFKSLWSQ